MLNQGVLSKLTARIFKSQIRPYTSRHVFLGNKRHGFQCRNMSDDHPCDDSLHNTNFKVRTILPSLNEVNHSQETASKFMKGAAAIRSIMPDYLPIKNKATSITYERRDRESLAEEINNDMCNEDTTSYGNRECSQIRMNKEDLSGYEPSSLPKREGTKLKLTENDMKHNIATKEADEIDSEYVLSPTYATRSEASFKRINKEIRDQSVPNCSTTELVTCTPKENDNRECLLNTSENIVSDCLLPSTPKATGNMKNSKNRIKHKMFRKHTPAQQMCASPSKESDNREYSQNRNKREELPDNVPPPPPKMGRNKNKFYTRMRDNMPSKNTSSSSSKRSKSRESVPNRRVEEEELPDYMPPPILTNDGNKKSDRKIRNRDNLHSANMPLSTTKQNIHREFAAKKSVEEEEELPDYMPRPLSMSKTKTNLNIKKGGSSNQNPSHMLESVRREYWNQENPQNKATEEEEIPDYAPPPICMLKTNMTGKVKKGKKLNNKMNPEFFSESVSNESESPDFSNTRANYDIRPIYVPRPIKVPKPNTGLNRNKYSNTSNKLASDSSTSHEFVDTKGNDTEKHSKNPTIDNELPIYVPRPISLNSLNTTTSRRKLNTITNKPVRESRFSQIFSSTNTGDEAYSQNSTIEEELPVYVPKPISTSKTNTGTVRKRMNIITNKFNNEFTSSQTFGARSADSGNVVQGTSEEELAASIYRPVSIPKFNTGVNKKKMKTNSSQNAIRKNTSPEMNYSTVKLSENLEQVENIKCEEELPVCIPPSIVSTPVKSVTKKSSLKNRIMNKFVPESTSSSTREYVLKNSENEEFSAPRKPRNYFIGKYTQEKIGRR